MDNVIIEYLSNLESQLLNQKRKPIELSESWAKTFPVEAGVYILMEEGEIRYVGETRSLRKRMSTLAGGRRHNVRWKIARANFAEQVVNILKKDCPPEVLSGVNQLIVDKLQIAAIPVLVGRKELEEIIIKKYEPIYNTIGNRER